MENCWKQSIRGFKSNTASTIFSGRYRTESLASHWSANKEGYCLSRTCCMETESVEHILLTCPAYEDCKKKLYSLWLSTKNKVVRQLVLQAFSSENKFLLQFILDCSVMPEVIKAVQTTDDDDFLNELFYLTRTWCFSVHRERMKMLGRWNFQR